MTDATVPPIAVVVGERAMHAIPIAGHRHDPLVAERLARLASIMARATDVEPHPVHHAWSVVVSGDERAMITPFHVSAPIGAQIPASASWVISPADSEEWREARPPARKALPPGIIDQGEPQPVDLGSGEPGSVDFVPGDAVRIVLPRFGTGPVMVHPTVPVLRECARFVSLAADVVAGRTTPLTMAQWDLVVATAGFSPTALPGRIRGLHDELVHNAGHPLRNERLTRLVVDLNGVVPRHTTHELPPPGAPQAMLLSLGRDPFVPTLEPLDTTDHDPRSRDAMSIMRAIEAMRAATGWTP